MPTPRTVWPIALALLAVYVIWGSTYLAVRFALPSIPPFLLTGVRFVTAGAILYLVLRLRGATPPSLRQWGNAALIGLLLMGGGMAGSAYAQQWVGSGVTALTLATVPLWTALVAGLFGEWPRPLEWSGIAVGLAGIALLNLEGDLRASPLGAVLLLLSAISWSFGSVWSRTRDLPAGAMATAAQMLTGGAALLATSAATGERLTGPLPGAPLAALAYLTIFGSLVAFSAYMYLLAHVRPALATSYAYVNPVLALALGVTLGGERVSAAGWLALPVVIAGVALVAWAQGRRQA